MNYIGGLKKCRAEGCTNTVHCEDAPEFYPCCPKHRSMNKAYWETESARRRQEEINKELYGRETDHHHHHCL